ncbi:hypothetical protein MSMAW_0672 [Methanosarcina mazei WWM610]|jgi:hypothetical protein|uniref:Uncharacterized protein n=4 Tax=Methanosarcina mazei TaxID=2209 RepID=A0A0F8K8M8_METMZ|nr:hypothetical protein [Methanosarcina mazei]AAM30337.1 conserved protein [Methanosarcina mazei Go1]AKB39663.1 hypothetical protein MSMAW_0672 [Methanosarcina mazei WWM610]AKB63864.1 hypothetical protein MSMAS_0668 [Methanosarcina mazei S-6]KKG37749.1 hypothetical protein DU52_19300 [Methanosarcina mazei]KKG70942.1 hypothetical protein DU63_05470 [Methanosarcina mazei]
MQNFNSESEASKIYRNPVDAGVKSPEFYHLRVNRHEEDEEVREPLINNMVLLSGLTSGSLYRESLYRDIHSLACPFLRARSDSGKNNAG